MAGVLTIYECPTCGRLTDGEAARARCAGAYYDGSNHDAVEMVPVRVFREEDVRPLWDALSRACWVIGRGWMREALDRFPAPEGWKS